MTLLPGPVGNVVLFELFDEHGAVFFEQVAWNYECFVMGQFEHSGEHDGLLSDDPAWGYEGLANLLVEL
jgi:hypothetical protein